MYISLTTYNRFEYLERSLQSLWKTDFPPDTHLVISDDNSTDIRVIELLASLAPPKNVDLDIIYNLVNVRCDANMVRTIKYCFSRSNDPYVITIDSDVLFNPQWLNKLLEGLDMVKDIKVAGLSVFNTVFYHPIMSEYNDFLYEKSNLGGFCAALNRDIFMRQDLRVDQWDWSYVELANKEGYRWFCTRPSYVQHFGAHGKSSSLDGYYDTADDFVGEG
jgi:GT2 family glycosyltransferase